MGKRVRGSRSITRGIVLLIAGSLTPITSLAIPSLSRKFESCTQANIKLVPENEWKTSTPDTALFPKKVGNFGTIHEGLNSLSGDSKQFLILAKSGVETLVLAQKEYAEELASCMRNPKSCSEEAKLAIQRDRIAIEKNWKQMRLGLAIGFPSLGCANRCYGFETQVSHLFSWAQPFATPSQMGAQAVQSDRNFSGALTLEEAKEADQIVRTVTGPILGRDNTLWDYLAHLANPTLIYGPDGSKQLLAAAALIQPGRNGQLSVRDQWQKNYFDSIQSAPLILYVSRSNPSAAELANAYEKIATTAAELLSDFASTRSVQKWEYLSLTARDVLMTYHGVINTILQDPANHKYCGIAERMLYEKINNDSTKFAVALGTTVAAGVGCVLTGSSYAGLGLCALTSITLTAKSTIDARRQAEAARQKAGSSATPTLLVDDYEALSNIDKEAITAEVMKYFAVIDIATLAGMTGKLSLKAYQFLTRLERFSEDLALAQRVDSKVVRSALKIILRDSPSLKEAKYAADILGKLPAGVITAENFSDIARASKAIAGMNSLLPTDHWARLIASTAGHGDDALLGLSLISEKTLQNLVLRDGPLSSNFAKALEEQISNSSWENGRFISSTERSQWRNSMLGCLDQLKSECGSGFARIGRSSLAETDEAQKLVNRLALAKASRQVINRNLTEAEIDALEKARSLGSIDAYTAEEVTAQNKLLTKAGWENKEISVLRKEGILGNWVKDTVSATPTGVKTVQTSKALDRAAVEEIRNGKVYRYFIDDLDQVRITDEALDMTGSHLLLARTVDPDGATQALRVKEAGELAFDKITKRMEFRPAYGHELTENHPALMNSEAKNAFIKANPNLQQAKVFQCLDVLQARKKGKGFILNSMLADNVVFSGAVLSGEILGAGRLKTEVGRELITTDLKASNLSWLINGFIRKKLAMSSATFVSYGSSRLASNFVLIEIQRQVFRAGLTDDGDRRSSNIRNYNAGWAVARMPFSYYFDQYLINTLPLQLYSHCSQHGKALKIVFHPGMVAIYEKSLAAVIYFHGRRTIVGE